MNEIQRLQFELMKAASFNQFDGDRVVSDLVGNEDLWQGAVMGSFETCPLVCLRDIKDGNWNVDTLYILSSGVDDEQLEVLAGSWHPDEVSWLTEEEALDLLGDDADAGTVLRVWWD